MSSMPVSKVFNGDCVAYMRTIPDNFFDIAIADPPYGMGNERFGGRFEKYNNGSRHVEWDTSPSQEYFDELFRVSRNQVIWGGQLFHTTTDSLFLDLAQNRSCTRLCPSGVCVDFVQCQ